MKPLAIRGYLLHITHYDPVWVKNKPNEKPFDPATACQVIDAMAEAGYNLLIIDAKDGVEYAGHPELKRHYTQSMDILREVAAYAAGHGIETAVKLNFSQSGTHQHNHWFRPHNNLFDNDEYWRRGFQIINELIEAAGVKRFFHIGMDEDHDRTITQFVAAVDRLHAGLSKRGLRTVMWNDSACHWPRAAVHREKSMAAEEHCAPDIIHVIWDYGDAIDREAVGRARARGLTVWGAPGSTPNSIAGMLQVLDELGGEGILMTRWIPCIPDNRDKLLERVRDLRL